MSAAAAPALSLWRPSPARFARLVTGLWIFGTGEALIIAAGLGNSPWTVLAQGVARQTPLAIGAATVAISFAVLLLWVPLRQRPGLGTVMNAILIGIAIDAALLVLPEPRAMALEVRAALLATGIVVVAIGSGLYLTCRLGPGPRDGLMTGLSRRTGRSLRLWRTVVEASALIGGVVLGGVAGIGTVAFALLIGPAVQAAVQRLDDPGGGAL
ncbi:MAG TPA: hypothetical protein VM266_14665 [Solirubrobacteraceae bacterium]|nr:hypothetical protein [Solirubrobacteraceae bacterium]